MSGSVLDQERDEMTADIGTPVPPAGPSYIPRPRRRPGRKPKGSAPVVVLQTPDEPDPDHVLTWRQRKILQVIRDSVLKRGYPPSMREIGDAVGLTSTSSVLYQLGILQRKGYLHRDVGRARTMEVRLPGRPAVRPEGAVTEPSGRELIASLASRRAELGLSRAEVARRMRTSQAAVANLEAQLAALVRYTEALGLLGGVPPNGHIRRVHPVRPQ
jgi:LexA DNA binding domain-containing protein